MRLLVLPLALALALLAAAPAAQGLGLAASSCPLTQCASAGAYAGGSAAWGFACFGICPLNQAVPFPAPLPLEPAGVEACVPLVPSPLATGVCLQA